MSGSIVPQRPLGRSGISVPAFTLGTANFGKNWGDGWRLSYKEASRLLTHAYDLGITALDTASSYNNGESENMLGSILSAKHLRNRFFITTKFGYRTHPTAPERGGSRPEAMMYAVETSLRRLRVETIDLLYLHLWDGTTPVEDTIGAAGTLMEQGKIRSFGLSNVPAWYVARSDAFCAQAGLPGIAAIQLNYNLLSRHVESEFGDVIRLFGCGCVAWGALADGLLTGKYKIDQANRRVIGTGRLAAGWHTTSPVDPFSDHAVNLVTCLESISSETGIATSKIALAWMLTRPLLSSIVLGVTKLSQLENNVGAATLKLDPLQLARLDAASRSPPRYPMNFLEPEIQVLVHGHKLPHKRPIGFEE